MKFDMQAARQMLKELNRDMPISIKIEKIDYLISVLPAALDRIEELEVAPSWQITEERKAALNEIEDMLTGNLFIEAFAAEIYVLRAMLAEAEDKP